MGNIVYIIAATLLIFWVIGYLALGVGPLIHILLVVALIAVIYRFIQGRKPL